MKELKALFGNTYPDKRNNLIISKFAEKHKLKFTLLSDEGNKIREQFGVPTNFLGFFPDRVTYIADKTGKVIYIFNSQLQFTKHVDEALRILKEHRKNN